MNLILESTIITIIVLFPVLFNLFIMAYKKITNKNVSDIYLSISLMLALYLSLFYISSLKEPLFLIFSTGIIFLSFICKRKFITFIIILIFLDYLLKFNINYYLFPVFILSIFITYYIYTTTEMTNKTFIWIFEIISLLYFIVEFHNLINVKSIFIFINHIIFTSLAYFFIKKSHEIFNIFLTFKDIEKEKFIKLSLFKITHEIKNPLAVVKGYLDMFNVNNIEKSTKYINIIRNEIKRTLNLLNDFNDFNKISINKTEVNFSILMSELKDLCIPYLEEHKIDYSFKTEENIELSIDPERIKQVLLNLIKNSIEASNEYDKLKFTSYINNNKLYILIEDTGKGMEKETLDNLFIPFNTTKEYGTGLGVCLSKEIIEAHKGSLSYTSIVNKGTTAKIVLPL